MRAKEDARDYRYLPEPDLPPLRLERERIEAWRAGLPERPADRRARFAARYGLPERNAVLLTAGPDRADFFEAVVAAGAAPGPAANWILTGVLGALARRGMKFSGLRFSPRALAELIGMVERRALSRPAARRVFDTLFEEGGEPAGIARRLGLGRIQDPGAIEALARRAVEENPAAAGACRAGKTAALQHLVGRVLGISGGAADPALAAGALRRLLGLTPGRSAPGRSSGRCTPSRPSLPRG